MSVDDEVSMHVNSAYRNNKNDNPCNFVINFNNSGNVQDALYFKPRSAMVPNMFFNVYGKFRTLYIANGSGLQLTIPSGNYTFDTVCAAINAEAKAQNILNPAFPDLVLTPTEVSPGVFRAVLSSPTIATALYGFTYIFELFGTHQSLNELIGIGPDTTDPVILAFTYTMPNPPSLFGPQRVNIVSERLSFAKSIDAEGVQSTFMSVSLVGVPYGSYASHETPDSSLFTFWFREPKEIQTVDIKIYDIYGQLLELPQNAHVDVVLVIGLSRKI